MRIIKVLGVTVIVTTSLLSFTPAFADEVSTNDSSEQVTLENIEEENTIQYNGHHFIQEKG